MHVINFSRLLLAIALVLVPTFESFAQSSESPRRFSEVHVIRSLRLLHSAQMTYQAVHGAGNFGSLENLLTAALIDAPLATGTKYGYVYALTRVTAVPGQHPASFVVTATPVAYRKTGIRSFFIDTSGEMRGGDRNGQPATVNDAIIDDCTNGSIVDNERCTILDVRAIHSAQMTYSATVGNGNFGMLNELYLAGLIRAGLSSGATRGYRYTFLVIDFVPKTQMASFKVWATPQFYPTSGVRSFYIDQTGVLRGGDKQGGQANENDPPIND